jgi:hypothetical protein
MKKKQQKKGQTTKRSYISLSLSARSTRLDTHTAATHASPSLEERYNFSKSIIFLRFKFFGKF